MGKLEPGFFRRTFFFTVSILMDWLKLLMDWLKLFCRVEDYIFGDKLFILFYLLDSQGTWALTGPP